MINKLIIEDDENVNRGIAFSLEKSGKRVFPAITIKEVEKIASKNKIDLVICDINLPDGNGLEFIKWIRKQYNTYIICLTALDQGQHRIISTYKQNHPAKC